MASEKAREIVQRLRDNSYNNTMVDEAIAAIIEAERGPVQHLGYISGAVDDFAAGRISASKFAELLGARDPQAFKQRCMTYGDEERGEPSAWECEYCRANGQRPFNKRPYTNPFGEETCLNCGGYLTPLYKMRGEPVEGSEQPLSSGARGASRAQASTPAPRPEPRNCIHGLRTCEVCMWRHGFSIQYLSAGFPEPGEGKAHKADCGDPECPWDGNVVGRQTSTPAPDKTEV